MKIEDSIRRIEEDLNFFGDLNHGELLEVLEGLCFVVRKLEQEIKELKGERIK